MWTTDQVAAYLKMSKRWVRDAASAGTLPSCLFGTKRRYVPSEVRAFALEQGRPTKAA